MITEINAVTINEPAIEWARAFLEERGCQVEDQFFPVRILPWSSVYQVKTSVGRIFLKQVAPPFAIEARLLIHLGCLMPDVVPEVVGHNDELNCFLMFDAGNPLREQLTQHYQFELVQRALEIYSTLQYTVSNDIESLLSLGVPDWRLTELPTLFLEFLNEKTFLQEEGLTVQELKTLYHLHSQVSALCQDLLKYNIPETIEHGDFQDNNILCSQQTLVINDWGDAVITHPFFSLIAFLKSAKRQHAVMPDSRPYLLTWVEGEPFERLQEALTLAERLNPIKFSLSFYRVAMCPGMQGLGEYQGTIAEALKCFITNESKS